MFWPMTLAARLTGLWLYGIAAAVVLGSVIWIVDEIGDRREAKVRAEYAGKVLAANKRAEDAEAAARLADEQAKAHRVELMGGIAAELSKLAANCVAASPELRARLDAIKPRGK